ncbi:MAG: hypothetical protein KAR47_00760 [Planctomycetes bacterium]|nr:hypothetical protein [Planctomycetota bacterium]
MDALTDQLCEHLKDSVKMRLVADVPVGILLSGGIDSSLVTAMAAEHSSKPVKTFTVSFPGHGGYDEAPFGRKVADYFDTDHTELIADPLSIDTLDEMAKQFDEPIADSSMIPTYLISKKISQYAKVALSGDGADELFGGYPHHSWIRQQDCLRRFVPRAFRCSLRKASLRLWPPGLRGRNYFMGCLSDLHGNIAQINTFFDPLIRKQLLTGVCSDKEFQYNSPEAYKISLCDCGQSPLQSATRVDFMTYLPEDILVKVDRAAMLASLEIRSPFLDHRIIEFAFGQVPDNLRATLNRRKILLRQLSERLMPNQLDLKRKQGFSMPIHEEFSGKWGDYCQQLLCKATDNLFDNSVIQRMITRQKKGFFNSDRLFALMIFELWRRHYQISV